MEGKNPKSEKVIKQFGVNVRKHRTSKGITMEQLATDCGILRAAISNIENAKVNTSISTAYILAKALDVSIDVLFEGI